MSNDISESMLEIINSMNSISKYTNNIVENIGNDNKSIFEVEEMIKNNSQELILLKNDAYKFK